MNIQIFNVFSIYWDKYMHTVSEEYWLGHGRKKILTIGRFTFWIRWNRKGDYKS